MEYGQKIVEQRKAHHLSQSELAEQLSITRQTLSRWESNAAKPDVDSLGKMAAIFGVKSDYFFAEDSLKHHIPEYQKEEMAKQKRQIIILLVLLVLLLLGSLALVIYGAIASQVGLIAGGAVALVLFLLIGFWSVSLARNIFAANRFMETGDEETFVAYTLKRYHHAQGAGKENYANVLASAYLDLNDLAEARKFASEIQNPLMKELASPTLILLLLDEGKYAEAKALYLVYAPHHRSGHSRNETHMVSALDGLFHALDGEEVSPLEQDDYQTIFDSALGKKLWASAPWKKEKREGAAIAQEQSHLESKQLESSINTYDAVTGQGERKLQSWLNFAFALSIVIFLSCFLIGALTVSRDDPHPLRQMWVMAFGALSGLGDMIFAIYARQKEPKDHTLYAVIGGTILLVLGILLSLTALA